MQCTDNRSISNIFKKFWNFCADFCPPSPKVWNFFSVAILEFSPAPTPPDQWCGYTPGGIFSNPPLASPHHWTGGAGSQKRSRKSFKLLATAERSVGQKSTQIFHFVNPCKKCENWNLKMCNLDFGCSLPPWPRCPPRGGAEMRHRHEGGTKDVAPICSRSWRKKYYLRAPKVQENRFLPRVKRE